jgi:hypothetical protein
MGTGGRSFLQGVAKNSVVYAQPNTSSRSQTGASSPLRLEGVGARLTGPWLVVPSYQTHRLYGALIGHVGASSDAASATPGPRAVAVRGLLAPITTRVITTRWFDPGDRMVASQAPPIQKGSTPSATHGASPSPSATPGASTTPSFSTTGMCRGWDWLDLSGTARWSSSGIHRSCTTP